HTTLPQRVLWGGPAALAELATELQRLGVSRAAIVCGASLHAHPTALPRVIEAAGGRAVTTIAAATTDSPVAAVEHVRGALIQSGADAVIAVGGGTAIVTARAATILLAEGRHAGDISTTIDEDGRIRSPRLRAPKLPQIVLPTTPTTAAAKAGAAVTDPDRRVRHALFDPRARPAVVLVDTTLAPPPHPVRRAAVSNAYAMAVEGLLSPASSMFSDALLVDALRTLAEELRRADDEHGPPRLDERTVLAALLAGEGTNVASVGLGAACSHALGLWSSHPNGILDAAVLPHVLAFNRPVAAARWTTLARALDCTDDDVIGAVVATTGHARLRDLGVKAADLDAVAHAALADVGAWQNPRSVTHSDVLEVLRAAW
nr:putative iron-containing alcohol dehydrogenase [Aeromicrobium sp.]